jgi:aspartyl-tRNA(Asn)/glutamyl-tRNA(Gln) amidotransferase subunit B
MVHDTDSGNPHVETSSTSRTSSKTIDRSGYGIVIGLEVHAQLLTKTKAYSADPFTYGEEPNTVVGLVTLAHPGALPKANRQVVDYAIRMGLATHCTITRFNHYDRKNYFYPDLPKGYQITQDKTPICRGGFIDITTPDGVMKRIGITRIHMEEDAGKSLHLPGAPDTLVDLNRAGAPLIEIVSEPDMRSTAEAYAYLQEIHRLVVYLGICDGNMEEGSLRCDANVSVRPLGQEAFGSKVEVKNMNSFRNVQRAIEFEVGRQIALSEAGTIIDSETRMYDAGTNQTYSLRSKETLNDYRYFPEADLQPVVVTEDMLEQIRSTMPELPQALELRMQTDMCLSPYDAALLSQERDIAEFFLAIVASNSNYKAAANWLQGPIKALLNEKGLTLSALNLSPAHIAGTIALIDRGSLSFTNASQNLLPHLSNYTGDVLLLAQQLNLVMDVSTDSLSPIIEQILKQFPAKVAEYKAGKKGLLGMFVGEVMKATKGKANPKEISELVAIGLEK